MTLDRLTLPAAVAGVRAFLVRHGIDTTQIQMTDFSGVFEILPRDQAPGTTESSQIAKIVRVVATIDYYLRLMGCHPNSDGQWGMNKIEPRPMPLCRAGMELLGNGFDGCERI
jgi:hypothetical protein